MLQSSDTKQLLRGFSATASSLPMAALRGSHCWMLPAPRRPGRSFLCSSRQQNLSLNSQAVKGLFGARFRDQALGVTGECFPRDRLLRRFWALSNTCPIRTQCQVIVCNGREGTAAKAGPNSQAFTVSSARGFSFKTDCSACSGHPLWELDAQLLAF